MNNENGMPGRRFSPGRSRNMSRQSQLLVITMIMAVLASMVMKSEFFAHPLPAQRVLPVSHEPPGESAVNSDMGGSTPASLDATAYRSIVSRNTFGVKATTVAPNQPQPLPPKQDLVLAGLAGLEPRPCAVFMVNEPGKAPECFVLHPGESNEWLEVRAIDSRKGTVTAVLKKPFVRVRSVGVEVVLSMKVHGPKSAVDKV